MEVTWYSSLYWMHTLISVNWVSRVLQVCPHPKGINGSTWSIYLPVWGHARSHMLHFCNGTTKLETSGGWVVVIGSAGRRSGTESQDSRNLIQKHQVLLMLGTVFTNLKYHSFCRPQHYFEFVLKQVTSLLNPLTDSLSAAVKWPLSLFGLGACCGPSHAQAWSKMVWIPAFFFSADANHLSWT